MVLFMLEDLAYLTGSAIGACVFYILVLHLISKLYEGAVKNA